MSHKHKDWTRYGIKPKYADKKYPKVFDTIIIGAGPAGMTSAVYAARRKMKILLICGDKIGGQMQWSSDIENYTGVKKITGPGLTDRFFHHVHHIEKDIENFDLWVRKKELVTGVKKNSDNTFTVTTSAGKSFETKTLIITAGKVPRTLGISGEEVAMQGNGLSFCATCDAPLYKDKKMAIIGGGNSAMDVALQLNTLTDDITLFTDIGHLTGEEVLEEKLLNNSHIDIKYNVDVKEILLDEKYQVRGLRYSEKGSKEKEFVCEGIFEEIGQLPATNFLSEFIELNKKGEIPIDKKCKTSLSGVFAAGDVTDEIHKQIVVAAGQGAIAALEAHEYVLKL